MGIGGLILTWMAIAIVLLLIILSILKEKSHNQKSIVIVLAVMGIFVPLLSIAGLVWALVLPKSETKIASASIGTELEKLSQLKNSGILSEEEFLAQKERLLKI